MAVVDEDALFGVGVGWGEASLGFSFGVWRDVEFQGRRGRGGLWGSSLEEGEGALGEEARGILVELAQLGLDGVGTLGVVGEDAVGGLNGGAGRGNLVGGVVGAPVGVFGFGGGDGGLGLLVEGGELVVELPPSEGEVDVAEEFDFRQREVLDGVGEGGRAAGREVAEQEATEVGATGLEVMGFALAGSGFEDVEGLGDVGVHGSSERE
jgi:hypothetical protein